MKIVSLHNGHDASITAMLNGTILYHWELERHMYRAKHYAGFHNENIIAEFLRCHALPTLLWEEKDIDIISLGNLRAGWIGEMYGESEFKKNIFKEYGQSLEQPYLLWEHPWKNKTQNFFANVHHVSHMAYSYYTGPFDEAVLFAYDGEGDFATTTTYGIGQGKQLYYKANFNQPPFGLKNNKIGVAFNRLGFLLPFLGTDLMATPGKAMGYSSYGKPQDKWKNHVRDMILTGENEGLLEKLGLPRNMDSKDQRAMDLMATIQNICEEYVLNTVETLIRKTGINQICLSGGCALNVLINSRIRKELCEKIYIPPACSDTGQSIGSALYLWHNVLQKPFFPTDWHNPYLGDFLQPSIMNRSNIQKSNFDNEEHMLDVASTLLSQNKIIGWAQGRSEIGPRALGNRSILCLPVNKNMKDIINKKIKNREWWRPFAPVCLIEDHKEWFQTNHEHPYMLECPQIKPDKSEMVPAIVHVDGSARLQTVSENQNKILHKLLMKVKEKTGIPMLLNTSLNAKNKPIVNHTEAIYDLLESSQLDCVIMGLQIAIKKS